MVHAGLLVVEGDATTVQFVSRYGEPLTRRPAPRDVVLRVLSGRPDGPIEVPEQLTLDRWLRHEHLFDHKMRLKRPARPISVGAAEVAAAAVVSPACSNTACFALAGERPVVASTAVPATKPAGRASRRNESPRSIWRSPAGRCSTSAISLAVPPDRSNPRRTVRRKGPESPPGLSLVRVVRPSCQSAVG